MIRIFAPIIQNIVDSALGMIPLGRNTAEKIVSPFNNAIDCRKKDALKILSAWRKEFWKVRDKVLVWLVAFFTCEELFTC